MAAIGAGKKDICALLLLHGADANHRYRNKSLREIAQEMRHYDIVKQL